MGSQIKLNCWWLVVLATVLLVHPGAATADDAKARAKAHTVAAKKEFNLGNFRAAADHYEKAYKAKPLPVFLFNLAQCHKRLETIKDLKKSQFYFRAFLNSSDQTPHRAAVEKEIADLDQRIKALQQAQEKQRQQDLERKRAAAAAAAAAKPKPKPKPAVPAAALPKTGKPDDKAGVGVHTKSTPVYKKWWFWTIVGVAVVGGGVAIGVAASSGGDDRVPQGPSYNSKDFTLGGAW